MTSETNAEPTDAELFEEAEELNDIMRVAVANAIAENERLGLSPGVEEKVASPRVAEDD